jgi:hypothetical protein
MEEPLQRCEDSLREVQEKLQSDITSLPSVRSAGDSAERAHMSEAIGFLAKAIVAITGARREIAALPDYELRYQTPHETSRQ